jgi:hypothetical protein
MMKVFFPYFGPVEIKLILVHSLDNDDYNRYSLGFRLKSFHTFVCWEEIKKQLDKIQKPSPRFELMTETIKTF